MSSGNFICKMYSRGCHNLLHDSHTCSEGGCHSTIGNTCHVAWQMFSKVLPVITLESRVKNAWRMMFVNISCLVLICKTAMHGKSVCDIVNPIEWDTASTLIPKLIWMVFCGHFKHRVLGFALDLTGRFLRWCSYIPLLPKIQLSYFFCFWSNLHRDAQYF